MSVTPVAWILCLVVFQILCYSIKKKKGATVVSNHIHVNPGPYCENNLKFMNWMLIH